MESSAVRLLVIWFHYQTHPDTRTEYKILPRWHRLLLPFNTLEKALCIQDEVSLRGANGGRENILQ